MNDEITLDRIMVKNDPNDIEIIILGNVLDSDRIEFVLYRSEIGTLYFNMKYLEQYTAITALIPVNSIWVSGIAIIATVIDIVVYNNNILLCINTTMQSNITICVIDFLKHYKRLDNTSTDKFEFVKTYNRVNDDTISIHDNAPNDQTVVVIKNKESDITIGSNWMHKDGNSSGYTVIAYFPYGVKGIVQDGLLVESPMSEIKTPLVVYKAIDDITHLADTAPEYVRTKDHFLSAFTLVKPVFEYRYTYSTNIAVNYNIGITNNYLTEEEAAAENNFRDEKYEKIEFTKKLRQC